MKTLPICPVGKEMENVRQFRRFLTSRGDDNDANSTSAVVGSVEQNIFTPLLYQNPELKVKAIASMFRTSPLCLASIIENDDNNNSNEIVVGAHDDTVPLLTRMLQEYPNYSVVGSPRSTKNTDLLEGTFDAIQAYTTTEVPTLERLLHQQGRGEVRSIPLEGMNGAKLGYSQMLFTPEEDLAVTTTNTTTNNYFFFETPTAIFANNYFNTWGNCERCLLTVMPISQALDNLPIDFNHGFPDKFGGNAAGADAIRKIATGTTATATAEQQQLDIDDDDDGNNDPRVVILVAWEHVNIQFLVAELGVDKDRIPYWKDDDYDTVYVLTLQRQTGKLVSFDVRAQNYVPKSTTCNPSANYVPPPGWNPPIANEYYNTKYSIGVGKDDDDEITAKQ